MTDEKGMNRKQMRKHVETLILEFLSVAGLTRSGEIIDHVEGMPKTERVSDRVCYEILEDMVDSGQIKKTVINRGNVQYSTKTWEDKEKERWGRLERAKTYVNDLIESYELHQNLLSIEKKAEFLHVIWATIQRTKDVWVFEQFQPNSTFADEKGAGMTSMKEFDRLEQEVLNLIQKHKKVRKELSRLIMNMLDNEHQTIYNFYKQTITPEIAFQQYKTGEMPAEQYENFKKEMGI